MTIKKAGAAGGLCSVMAVIAIVLSSGDVRTNETGLSLIGNAEGCYTNPYICPAGVPTDGLGNTHNVRAGKSLDEIAKDWQRNIKDAERFVNRNFRGAELNDNQFSAMTSAAFNLGNGLRYYRDKSGVMRQTTIYKRAQAGDFRGMCERLPDFVRAGGKVLPGLVTRRQAEKELCLKPEAN